MIDSKSKNRIAVESINALLTEIQSYGWRFPVLPQTGLQWPLINESEVEPEKQNNSEPYDMERLGIFHKILGTNAAEPGWITLYTKAIARIADEFARNNPESASPDEARKALTTLVLMHELGHWVVYDVQGRFTYRLLEDSRDKEQELFFHEALAQYFTQLGVGKNELLQTMFDWLVSKQTKPYQAFKDLPADRIDLALLGIEFARAYKGAEFDVLKEFMNELRGFTMDYPSMWAKVTEFMTNPTTKPHLSLLKDYIESGYSPEEFNHKKRGSIATRKFGF